MNPLVKKFQAEQAAREKREWRNQLQRARRASPEQKEKDVAANRKSRFRKWARENGYATWTVLSGCNCTFCVKAKGRRVVG